MDAIKIKQLKQKLNNLIPIFTKRVFPVQNRKNKNCRIPHSQI